MAAVVTTAGRDVIGLPSTSGMAAPKMHFKPVLGPGREDRLEIVREFFNRVLHPLYGSQASALGKIESDDSDRTCRLLYADDVPVGVIVFKKALSDEYSGYGITKSLQIKTLALLDSKKFSGKGYGSILLDKVLEVARDLRAQTIHVTISETQVDSLNFFKKKNFFSIHTFDGLYKPSIKEQLLSRRLLEAPAALGDAERKEADSWTADHSGKKRRATDDIDGNAKKLKSKDDKGSSATAPASSGAAIGTSADVAGGRPAGSHHSEDDRRSPSRPGEAAVKTPVDRGAPSREPAAAAPRAFYAASRHSSGFSSRPLEATLRKLYLDMIKLGIKTIEGRIDAGMFRFTNLKIGQSIRFFYTNPSGRDEVTCEITDIKRYASFAEMLRNEGYKPCVPNAKSMDDAVNIYNNIPGYAARAAQSGVLAIHIKKKS